MEQGELTFAIDPLTGEITVEDPAELDFETHHVAKLRYSGIRRS